MPTPRFLFLWTKKMNAVEGNIIIPIVCLSLIIGGSLLLLYFCKYSEMKNQYILVPSLCLLGIGIIGLMFFCCFNPSGLSLFFTFADSTRACSSRLTSGQFPLLAALAASTLTLIVISGRYMDRMTDLSSKENLEVWQEKAHTTYSCGYHALNYVIILQMINVWLLLIRIYISVVFSLEIPYFDQILLFFTLVLQGIVYPIYFYWITSFSNRHKLRKKTEASVLSK